MQNRKNLVNALLVVMGIACIAVLILPWYELNASSHISGYGSSSLSGPTQMGFTAAGTSFWGYALYALPVACIYLGLNKVDLPARSRALLMEFIGLGELLCLVMLNSSMADYGTSISGYGYSSSAGYEPITGWYVALAVYAITGAVGFIMMFVAPKEPAQTENTEPASE